jgi:hypothetical protein
VKTYYAAAGLGYGVDVSHYGAPYKGMLGIGSYVGEYVNQPLGTLYAAAGLGQAMWPTGPAWTPAAGQIPADDPRMVRQYATVRSTYSPRGISPAQAPRAADLLVAEAQRQFPGNTVRKIGTTGWTNDGQVGYEVILAQETRAGDIKRKNKAVGDIVGPTVGTGTSFYNALTWIRDADIAVPTAPALAPSAPSTYPGQVPPPSTTLPGPSWTPAPTEAQPGFFEQEVGGVPVWAVGLIGIAVLGGVAFVVLRKPSAAPTANSRRRRYRRRR